ncbi:hypothetical protein GIB67_024649 [Kingdonia uniflora]|uniref:Uncharacterized protein n=1 Tax=Kingdonia uniflora TaxID=39325 RepID=A0A7J7LPE1_9MAGN|nr:hypothetical protein GIB67_024649 [Kingdonia uniflora]
MSGLVTKLRFCSKCQKNRHNRRSCKLLPIPSDDNTRPTMAPSFTMSTEPHVIPDKYIAISLHLVFWVLYASFVCMIFIVRVVEIIICLNREFLIYLFL